MDHSATASTNDDRTTLNNGPELDEKSSSSPKTENLEAAPPALSPVPDGGLRAWTVILGAFFGTFTTFGFINAWGVFQAYYEEDMLKDISPSAISWIGSIEYSFVFMTGFMTGRLFDMGYFKIPLGIASVVLVVATFLIAECHKYWHFLLCQGVAVGIACGFIMGFVINIPSQWFMKKKSLAYGVVGSGSGLGGIVFPIAARKLIPLVGFPWTMRIIAFMQLASLLIVNAATARRTPPKGVYPINWRVFRNPAFTIYCLAACVAWLGLYTCLTYIDLSAQSVGMPSDFSFYLVAIANAGSVLGRVAGGFLGDFVGPLNVLMSGVFVTGIMTYAWPFATTKGAFVIIAIIYGIASGTFVSLFGPPLFAMGEMHDIGMRFGFYLTIMGCGALAGPPISGAIAQSSAGYKGVGYFAGSVIVVSSILMFISRYFLIRKLWGKA